MRDKTDRATEALHRLLTAGVQLTVPFAAKNGVPAAIEGVLAALTADPPPQPH